MRNEGTMEDYIKDEYHVGVHFRPTPRSVYLILIIISGYLFLILFGLLYV